MTIVVHPPRRSSRHGADADVPTERVLQPVVGGRILWVCHITVVALESLLAEIDSVSSARRSRDASRRCPRRPSRPSRPPSAPVAAGSATVRSPPRPALQLPAATPSPADAHPLQVEGSGRAGGGEAVHLFSPASSTRRLARADGEGYDPARRRRRPRRGSWRAAASFGVAAPPPPRRGEEEDGPEHVTRHQAPPARADDQAHEHRA